MSEYPIVRPNAATMYEYYYVKNGTSYAGRCWVSGVSEGKVIFRPQYSIEQIMPLGDIRFREIKGVRYGSTS